MPDALIASAFVTIAPEPNSVKAFGTTVKTQLSKQLASKPIPIPVAAQLLPFKRKIQTELSTGKFSIAVTAVLAPGSKAALQAQLKALSGLVVPVTGVITGATAPGKSVPVIPPAGGKGGTVVPPVVPPAGKTGKATPPKTPAAVFDQSRKKATDALTLAQTKLNATTAKGITIDEQARRATAALTASESALTTAQKNQIAVGDTVNKRQAARLQKDVVAAERLRADVLARRADITAQKDLAKAAPKTGTAALTAEEKQLQAVQRARLATSERIIAADQAGALSTTKISKARAVLRVTTANLAAAEDVRTAAVRTGVQSEIALAEALVRRATVDQRAAKAAFEKSVADRAASTEASKRATKEALFGRGVGATGLSALGARGATLAASGEFLAGAAVAVALFKSISLAAKLETELNVFRVTAKATAAEMINVSNKAKQLGADITLPAVSANDAAEAMTSLAKAGLTVQESMDAARGTLQLATAASLDNETAVNITASALNAFGLAGSQAVHVADLLTGASNEAQGGIDEMGASLGQVGAVARQTGVSIEDTVAFLTLLAKNGIQGAEGGTALKIALLRLIAPTDKARGLLRDLNIQVLDIQGNVRPEVFSDLQREVDKLTPSLRNQALATIFGARAIRAQAVLGREGIVGLNAMREATNQSGLAADLAGARTSGFAGKLESLENSASTTGLSLGQILIPPVTLLVEGINQDVTAIGKLIEGLRKLGNFKFEGFGLPGDKAVERSFDPGQVGRFLDEVTAGIPVMGKFFDPISSKSEESKRALGDLGAAIDATAGKTAALSFDLSKAVRTKGISGAVKDIRDLEEKIKIAKPPNAEELLAYLQAVERALVGLGKAPNAVELKFLLDKGFIPDSILDVQDAFDRAPLIKLNSVVAIKPDANREAAAKNANLFAVTFGQAVTTDLLALISPDIFTFEEEARQGGADTAQAFASSFQTQLAEAELTPTLTDDLAKQRQILARRESLLARARAARDKAKTPKAFAKADAFVQRAAGLVGETQDAIEQITGEQESTAKAAADDITKAKNEADQKILDAISGRQGRVSNLILKAQGTPRLTDDIKRHTQMRDEIRRDIREAAAIKDAKLRAQTIQSLTADLIKENQTIADLNKQLADSVNTRFQARIDIAAVTGTISQIRRIYAAWLKELRKTLDAAKPGTQLALDLQNQILQTQQTAFDAINEGFTIDIDIAVARGNERAEIKARERYIAQLKREQDQYRRGTVEWKRLQLEIEEQNKAIKDAKGEISNNKTASEEFAFLQRQQGFVSNLLGNLIPSIATEGLVGGSVTALTSQTALTDPAQKVAQASAATQAKVQARPTAGQATTTNDILNRILAELKQLNHESAHPEAKYERKAGGSAMDVM